MKVLTTKGLVEFADLEVKDVIEVGENHRKVVVKYFLGDELVKQSVHIDLLRPVESVAEHGHIG